MLKQKKKNKYAKYKKWQLLALYKSRQYRNFRTGLTFKEVARELYLEQKKKRQNFEYMFITRRTILGRWHQIKLTMFEMYNSIDEDISRQKMIQYLENKIVIKKEKELPINGDSFII